MRARAEEDRFVAARKAMERGVTAEQSGDLETALAHYERARVLAPEANLPHRHAAEILVALERYEEAAEAFEAYLGAKPDVKDAPDIRARIERIRREHAKVLVRLESKPFEAEVFLDGADSSLGTTPISVEVSRGPHTLVCRKDGFVEVRVRGEVGAGANVLSCEFPSVITPTAPSLEAESSELPWIWMGTGAIVVVAGVVTALVLSARPGLPETRGGEHTFP